jgi:hypothetical protein
MKDLSGFIVALILVATSVALIVRHVRVWKRLKEEELDERELNFRRRQFRRRVQTSAMIGLLGVAIVVGQLLLKDVDKPLLKFQVYYWIGVLALLLWILLLAVADMVATSAYYSRERSDFAVQHAKLQVELRKARERAGRRHNGKPGTEH